MNTIGLLNFELVPVRCYAMMSYLTAVILFPYFIIGDFISAIEVILFIGASRLSIFGVFGSGIEWLLMILILGSLPAHLRRLIYST